MATPDDYDVVDLGEVQRLNRTGRATMRARWKNVLAMWQAGKTAEEIGQWIGRSASTATKLVKRAAKEEQKQPGYRWPTDTSGKKICDIAHPMPTWNERQTLSDPNVWAHPRAKPIKPRKVVGKKITPYRAFCPVCHRPFFIGRPLIEVLCEPDNFGKQKQRKIIEL